MHQQLKEFFLMHAPFLVSMGRRVKHFLGGGRNTEHLFGGIFYKKAGSGRDSGADSSFSGGGSNLAATESIREALPVLVRELRCESMLDIPCGDFFWMKTLDLDVRYTGADIVGKIVQINERRFAGARRRFIRLDITKDNLPKTDLVLCRDCLVHLSFSDISKALANIRRSGSTYVLTTSFPDRTRNEEIPTGSWRPLNLQRPPFNFPSPLKAITEGRGKGKYGKKLLALWRISDIPA